MSARAWRRLERRARAAHDQETLSAARGITGVLDVVADTSGVGVLRFLATDAQLTIGGALVSACMDGSQCQLDGAGRYGRWWWVRILTDGRAVTVLGSHLRVDRREASGPGPVIDSPAGGGLILMPCPFDSPLATSPA